MITFRSKLIKYLAIIILIFIIYQNFKEYRQSDSLPVMKIHLGQNELQKLKKASLKQKITIK